METNFKKGNEEKHGLFQVVIDGKKIKDYVDFTNAMQHEFNFPRECHGSIDRYLDWMRDLSWIDANEIIIKIKNSSSFLDENPQERELILKDLNEIIILFWADNPGHVIINGVKKKIQLFLAP